MENAERLQDGAEGAENLPEGPPEGRGAIRGQKTETALEGRWARSEYRTSNEECTGGGQVSNV
jgi:hypothetical protein